MKSLRSEMIDGQIRRIKENADALRDEAKHLYSKEATVSLAFAAIKVESEITICDEMIEALKALEADA